MLLCTMIVAQLLAESGSDDALFRERVLAAFLELEDEEARTQQVGADAHDVHADCGVARFATAHQSSPHSEGLHLLCAAELERGGGGPILVRAWRHGRAGALVDFRVPPRTGVACPRLCSASALGG